MTESQEKLVEIFHRAIYWSGEVEARHETANFLAGSDVLYNAYKPQIEEAYSSLQDAMSDFAFQLGIKGEDMPGLKSEYYKNPT